MVPGIISGHRVNPLVYFDLVPRLEKFPFETKFSLNTYGVTMATDLLKDKQYNEF